jgi:hypothetical protein
MARRGGSQKVVMIDRGPGKIGHVINVIHDQP